MCSVCTKYRQRYMGFPIELDEGFAMAHGCLAYWYQQRARLEDAKKTLIQPLALTPGGTRRERQQIEAIGHWISGRGPELHRPYKRAYLRISSGWLAAAETGLPRRLRLLRLGCR